MILEEEKNDGYVELGNAIVKQGAEDYKNAYLGIVTDSQGVKTPEDVMKEVEKFFHSDWYEYLTGVDPDWLLREIKGQALRDIIEDYDHILDPLANIQINFSEKKGKGNKIVFSHTVAPIHKEYFFETIEWHRDELKRELDKLYGINTDTHMG